MGQAHLTREDPEVISVPGIRDKMYPQDIDGSFCMANRDAHTAYIGEIITAYRIR